MKQVLKQLGVGILSLILMILAIMGLRKVSEIFLSVTSNIDTEAIIQNWKWILFGAVAIILVEFCGALMLYLFGPKAKIRRQERAKQKAESVSRGRNSRNNEEYINEEYAVPEDMLVDSGE